MNLLLGVMVGLALGGLMAVVVVVLAAAWNRPPLLTRERFDAQRAQWNQQGVADYDVEVHVTGRREATYAVSVREGVAVSATIDGRPLRDRRTFATWSVPGMFETIERDLETIERSSNREEPAAARLTLYAKFDSAYGFPDSYHRIVWGETAANADVTWSVKSFRPLPEPNSTSME
ncbi:MAG: DUF6174 domain-containing protein [Pirellulaceae bacterium]